MTDKIGKIANISYDSSSVASVRGYTAKERAAIMEAVEKESQARLEVIAEKRAYLAKYPTPKGSTFTELLDEAMGKSNPVITEEDEDGFVLDITK